MKLILITLLTATTAIAAQSHAAPATQPATQPAADAMYIEVYVRGEKRDLKVAGKLAEHDDERVTINASSGLRAFTWDELTPSSAFTLKSRLIDKTSAADWLALGTWGWERGLEQQGKTAFATARKLDASVSAKVDEVMLVKAGSKNIASKPPAPAAPAVPVDEPATATPPVAAGEASAQDDVAALTPGFERGQKIVQFKTPTPEEIERSLDRSRKFAAKTKSLMKVELVELETAHFLIYTDWDLREHNFLKDKCEGAYRVLARQFALKSEDTIFVGKLPIYMFSKPKQFQEFAAKMDKFRASATVLGYFINSDEIGHMAMWKPSIGSGVGAGGSLEEAQRNWGRTLVHEFSHAFLNRYKSSARIPRWMNEGLAEVISETELPTNNYRSNARELAMHQVDVSGLFDDSNMPSGAAYPVMMTMVEWLVKKDNKAFVAMVKAIKDGEDPEDALEKQYGMRYDKFAEGWLKYARSLK